MSRVNPAVLVQQVPVASGSSKAKEASKETQLAMQVLPSDAIAFRKQVAKLEKTLEEVKLNQVLTTLKSEVSEKLRDKAAEYKKSRMLFTVLVTAAVFSGVIGLGMFIGGLLAPALIASEGLAIGLGLGSIFGGIAVGLGGVFGFGNAAESEDRKSDGAMTSFRRYYNSRYYGLRSYWDYRRTGGIKGDIKDYEAMKRHLDSSEFLTYAKKHDALSLQSLNNLDFHRMYEAEKRRDAKVSEMGQIQKIIKQKEAAIRNLDEKKVYEKREKANLLSRIRGLQQTHRIMSYDKRDLDRNVSNIAYKLKSKPNRI